MNRRGSGEAAHSKLKKLKSYSNVIVSMDLFYNYPEQEVSELIEDLEKIIQLDLDGVSMYSLINMKETQIDEAGNQEKDEAMFYAICNHMEDAGYSFLESTKMVKKDKYKYIMNRHKGADTLMLGAGAGGILGGLALMNPIQLDEYESSVLNFSEKVGMAFQKSYKEVSCFKGELQTTYLPKNINLYESKDIYEEFLQCLIVNKMIKSEGDRYRFTHKGVFWGNTISRELSNLMIKE